MESQIIVLIQALIAVLFSAFFSGMEIAFVSSNQLRYEIDRSQKELTHSILGIFYNNKEQYIATILVGNNIALVIYGIKMAELLRPSIYLISHNEAIIAIIQTFISTIIILFTGEFLPKNLVKISPNFFLKAFSVPLLFFYILLYPISVFTSFLTKGILRIFGIKITSTKGKSVLSRVDLDYLLQTTMESEIENIEVDNEVKILQKALDFSSVRLRDCMVPRTEIVSIDINGTIEELKAKFINSGFSKIIVYKEDIDNIVGYVHSVEMFKRPDRWQDNINEAPIVPETMSANKLMNLLLQEKKSLAVVVDEFGGTSGIVSLEDMVEEIFGEIEDEHDNNEYIIKKISDTEYVLSGRLEIELLNNEYELNLPESGEYLTLAGLILHFYEKIPKVNDIVNIDEKFSFKILKTTSSKIELVKLIINE